MSKILPKAFDATKRIIRSIFRGSPNLTTTSDINRQFEALKYQLDQLDEKTGFLAPNRGDVVISSFSGNKVIVLVKCPRLMYKGCEFSFEQEVLLEKELAGNTPLYVVVTAEVQTLTYENDPTHEIAGAKFESGDSSPAADQLVYRNERFEIRTASELSADVIGVLARIVKNEFTGELLVAKNFTNVSNGIVSFYQHGYVNAVYDGSVSGPIKVGDSHDRALSRIQNRLASLRHSLVPEWTNMLDPQGNTSNKCQFKIDRGALYIRFNPVGHQYSEDSVRINTQHIAAWFDDDISKMLISYFNAAGIDTSKYDTPIYGNLGTAYMYNLKSLYFVPLSLRIRNRIAGTPRVVIGGVAEVGFSAVATGIGSAENIEVIQAKFNTGVIQSAMVSYPESVFVIPLPNVEW